MWRLAIWILCAAGLTGTAGAEVPGLLGHWKFDGGAGDIALDSSGNENDGEIYGAEWVRGAFGTALYFDGTGDHVVVPEVAGLEGSDELTLQAWVYWEGTGRYPNIITGGRWSPGGFMIFVQDDRCTFRMGRPDASATKNKAEWREVGVNLVSRLERRRWYHLAAVFKRPTITTYVNGKKVGSAHWDHPVGYAGDLVIGRWGGRIGHRGLIDEVKLFNRARSAEEVASDYRQTAAGRTTASAGQVAGSDSQVSSTTAYTKIPHRSQLAAALARFETRYATLAISSRGRCIALIDKATGEDRLARSRPLVLIKRNGKLYRPSMCSKEGDALVFQFARAKTTVALKVEAKPEYFVFDVSSVSNPDVEEVTLAEFVLKRCSYISPMSGLAADDRFGVCLRTLNLETYVRVGGREPLLHASVSREHGLSNGRAALVAAPIDRVRPVLQALMENEGVVHSKLGGPFALDAEANRGSYVFARVAEKDVDRWIELARRGGIATIHLSGWNKSLGHY